MSKLRRKSLGDYHSLASSFYRSARTNFEHIRERNAKSDSCGSVEHYTDVVAEATVAEAVAHEAGDDALAERARKLARTAVHAQRGAVMACRRGVRTHR